MQCARWLAAWPAWLVIDGELRDRPDNNSAEARERTHLYNTSTLVALTIGCSSATGALRRVPGLGAVCP